MQLCDTWIKKHFNNGLSHQTVAKLYLLVKSTPDSFNKNRIEYEEKRTQKKEITIWKQKPRGIRTYKIKTIYGIFKNV